MADPQDETDYRQIYKPLKNLHTNPQAPPVNLCRDTRDGSLWVLKVFRGPADMHHDPEKETEFFEQVSGISPFVIMTREILGDFPCEDDYTVAMELTNGGLVQFLKQAISENKQWVPEAFVWHIFSQTIEGIGALRRGGFNHGDCHVGNVFLNFQSRAPSGRALVKLSLDFPDVKLADPMFDYDNLYTPAERLGIDLHMFGQSFKELLFHEASNRSPCLYSEGLLFWLDQWAANHFEDESVLKKSLEAFDEEVQQFRDVAPDYIAAAGEKRLPMWLANWYEKQSRAIVSFDEAEAPEWDPCEEVPVEETSTETSTEKTSTEESPRKESPGEESPGEESPGEESPGEESPGEESPGEEPPLEESPPKEAPPKETPPDEPQGKEAPKPEVPSQPPQKPKNDTVLWPPQWAIELTARDIDWTTINPFNSAMLAELIALVPDGPDWTPVWAQFLPAGIDWATYDVFADPAGIRPRVVAHVKDFVVRAGLVGAGVKRGKRPLKRTRSTLKGVSKMGYMGERRRKRRRVL